MEIKAFACDVDSTLTNDVGLGDLYAVEAIRYLESLGLPVIVVTSRDYPTAGSLSTLMGACGVVVAEDGTLVGNCRSSAPPMMLGDAATIKQGLAVLREVLGDKFTLFHWPARICTAVLFVRGDTSIDQANAILTERGVQARLVDFDLVWVLNDIKITKGTGLREAANMLGIQPGNIVAIGDNFNDLDMFAEAGYSIAVGNAPQAVKDQVDYACSAHFGAGFCEGVQHALERFSVPGVPAPLRAMW
jgi:phosphoglycolate phosphatase (TIGR01487 family)